MIVNPIDRFNPKDKGTKDCWVVVQVAEGNKGLETNTSHPNPCRWPHQFASPSLCIACILTGRLPLVLCIMLLGLQRDEHHPHPSRVRSSDTISTNHERSSIATVDRCQGARLINLRLLSALARSGPSGSLAPHASLVYAPLCTTAVYAPRTRTCPLSMYRTIPKFASFEYTKKYFFY